MTSSQIFFSFVLLQLQAMLMTTPNTQRKIVLKTLQKVEGLNKVNGSLIIIWS